MSEKKINFLVSTKDFFNDVVQEAIVARKMSTFPLAQNYLVSILENYIHTNNLFDTHSENGKKTRDTLAETFLKAQNSNPTVKIELLKKLGDVSLYVSGFFADSLSRKIVDVDYYVDMGEVAYATLASEIKEDTSRKVFKDFSSRFLEYVDLLTTISQKSLVQNDESILRLYEKYLKTGSELARETLEEKGIVTIPFDKDKKSVAQ
ncbi:MAG: hypothetical protein V4596_04875 [Bdellovibrionota bacterium]